MSEFFNEDCMVGMKRFPDKYFDLAIVDPPYGIGVLAMNYAKGGDMRNWGNGKAKRKDYRKQGEWDIKPDKSYFDELFRVSKAQIIWGGGITLQIFCLPQKALLYGIKDVQMI